MQLSDSSLRFLIKSSSMKNILLTIGLLLLPCLHSLACAVYPSAGPFFPIIKNDDSMIARGKIIEKHRTHLVVELYEVYRGDETRCKVKIFNNKDWNCTGIEVDYELSYFGEVGQTFLFHADKLLFPKEPWEEVGEYLNMYPRIGRADEPVEPIIQIGDELRGWMDEGLSTIPLDKVGEKLLEYEVKNLLPNSRPLCGVHVLGIYPNPALDHFYIDDEIGEEAELSIYNTQGQLVLSNPQIAKGEKVLVSQLASGLYIISVKSDKATFRQKLLVS